MFAFLESVSDTWFAFVWPQSVQTTVVTVIAIIAVTVLYRRSANLRYAILLIALVKFAIPPFVTFPDSFIPTRVTRIQRKIVDGTIAESAVVSARQWNLSDDPTVLSATDDNSADSERDNSTSRNISKPPPMSAAEFIGRFWQPVLLAIYAFGLCCTALILFVRLFDLRKTIRNAAPLKTKRDIDFEKLTRLCRTKRRPEILLSDSAAVPFAAGLLRSVVLLPTWTIEKLSRDELQWVIAHETIHHRRGDLWIAWIQSLLAIVWWFHPALWLLNRRLRTVREECCDDSVLLSGLGAADEYARTLVTSARCAISRTRSLNQLVPTMLHSSEITNRVNRAIRRDIVRRDRTTRLASVAVLLFAALVLPNLPSAVADGDAETVVAVDTAKPASLIEGSVVDTNGNPIADARVTTYPRVPGDSEVTTKTDGEGKFSVVLRDRPGFGNSNRVMGAVYKQGLSIGGFDSVKQPIRIVLQKSDRIQFRIVRPDGKPVNRATIAPNSIHHTDAYMTAPPPRPWADDIAVWADDGGHATLANSIRHELRSVLVTAENWGQQRFPLPRRRPDEPVDPEPIEIRLQPVGVIEGTLAAANGQMAPGRELLVRSPIPSAENAQGGIFKTDGSGSFRCVLPTGRYRVVSGKNSTDSIEPKTVVLREGQTARLELMCLPTRRVFGRVLTDEGNAASKVPLGFSAIGDRKIVETDKEGRFELQLAVGTWEYACYADEVGGYLARQGDEETLTVEVKPDADVNLPDLVVPTGKVIDGQILGVDTSVSRIRVVIVRHGGKSYWSDYDADGKFRITIPREVSIEQLEEIEIRFIEKPISVVSTEPLVLQVSENE